MLYSIKTLIFVVVIAGLTFRLLRNVFLKFIPAADYARRRNVWFMLTAAEFLAPGVWTFIAIAIPILVWAARRESNLAALYMVLFWVVPPFVVRVPLVGSMFLLDLNFRLLMCIFVMFPAAWSSWRSRKSGGTTGVGFGLVDFCLCGYFLFDAVHSLRPEIVPGILVVITGPDLLRRIVVAVIGIIIPYMVVSRAAARGKAETLDALASFCMACAVLSTLAVFEVLRHWVLYAEIIDKFGVSREINYLMRDGLLRARVSTGHPLNLGLALVIALGFALSLRAYLSSAMTRAGLIVLYWAGLIAAYSRGPWVAAVSVWCVHNLLRPRMIRNLATMTLVGGLVLVMLLLSPLGDRIMRALPFSGQASVDAGNIDYRQRLADRSKEIFMDNPVLGDQEALLRMQDLRQGEGIIDLVNAYASIALGGGSVGLALYLVFSLGSAFSAWRWGRRWNGVDPAFSRIGTGLAASICGVFVSYASQPVDNPLLCAVVGIAVAYRHVSIRELRGAGRVAAAVAPAGSDHAVSIR